MNYQNRITQLVNLLSQKGLDSVLISCYYNILYFVGFAGLSPYEQESWLIITPKNIYHITDSRYQQQIESLPANFNQNYHPIITSPNNRLFDCLAKIIIDNNINKIGVEENNLRLIQYQLLKTNTPKVCFINIDDLLIQIRQIKSDLEINLIKKACQETITIYNKFIKNIGSFQTEKQILHLLKNIVNDYGYELAFNPIIAIDQNSSIAHYSTKNGNNQKLKKDSLILIDFGLIYQNYFSDFTRIHFFDKTPQTIKNQYQQLLKIQKQTIKKVKKGAIIKDIDSFCRQSLINLGFEDYYHSTGHGIGLEIHEYPKINSINQDRLKQNQVFTIEPAIYYPGEYGLRIEDVIVCQQNQSKVLTK